MCSMKSMFWTNEKLSFMIAWSPSVSISCFKVHSSIGHLVWFFDNGTSIVSLRFSQKNLQKSYFFWTTSLKTQPFSVQYSLVVMLHSSFSLSLKLSIFSFFGWKKTKPIIFPSGEPLTVNLYLISNI